MTLVPSCRWCGAELRHTFVDLGMSPLCESYAIRDRLNEMEPFYPLHAWVCGHCFLVQLEAYVRPEEIFSDYAYFSSFSDSWVAHARTFADMAVERFALAASHRIVEVASNDGYLLRHFVARGLPVLGIEPARNVAQAAVSKGVPTLVKFFGRSTAGELAAQGHQADLLIGNNVLAQVPDLRDFVAGLQMLLAPHGVLTLEFPHLLRLIDGHQFDTIYHEHFSYFSFTIVVNICADLGLTVFDVDELATHGGSLRVYARHDTDASRSVSPAVARLLRTEAQAGISSLAYYASFGRRVEETKRKLLTFLIEAKRAGRSVAGYGTPGKGNTLLNYCGIRTDFLDYTVDRNPHKQGKFLPGTHIPIFALKRSGKRGRISC